MLVTMSDKEIHRLPVIQAVCEKRLRRRDAASQLGISERQAQRLINRYRVSGAEGLVSRKRGQPSNRRLTESLKLRVLKLIRENYSDFGPTLAAEKLRERHDIRLSIETVRNWITLGELDEAIDYVNHNIKSWMRIPTAIEWIVKHSSNLI